MKEHERVGKAYTAQPPGQRYVCTLTCFSPTSPPPPSVAWFVVAIAPPL